MKAIKESDKVTRQEFWHVMDVQLGQHVLDKHDRDSHWMLVSLVDYQLVRSQPYEIDPPPAISGLSAATRRGRRAMERLS